MKQFALVGHYISQAVQSPASWFGAVLAVVFKTLTPTPELAAAVLGLFALCILDALLAIVHAFRAGTPITSKRASDGVFKLIAYGIALGTVAIMKLAYPQAGDIWSIGMSLCIGLFMAREALSIAEHLEIFGVRLPKKLTRFLKGIEKDADKGSLADVAKENT